MNKSKRGRERDSEMRIKDKCIGQRAKDRVLKAVGKEQEKKRERKR